MAISSNFKQQETTQYFSAWQAADEFPGAKGMMACEEPGSRTSHPAPEGLCFTFDFSQSNEILPAKGDSCATRESISDKTLSSHMTDSAKYVNLWSCMMQLTGSTWAVCAPSHAYHSDKILLEVFDFFQYCSAAWLTTQPPLIPRNRDGDLQDQARNSATFNYLHPNPRPVHSTTNLATKQQHRSHAESGLPGCSSAEAVLPLCPLSSRIHSQKLSTSKSTNRDTAESGDTRSWICWFRL